MVLLVEGNWLSQQGCRASFRLRQYVHRPWLVVRVCILVGTNNFAQTRLYRMSQLSMLSALSKPVFVTQHQA
jgi:hypothetical protein